MNYSDLYITAGFAVSGYIWGAVFANRIYAQRTSTISMKTKIVGSVSSGLMASGVLNLFVIGTHSAAGVNLDYNELLFKDIFSLAGGVTGYWMYMPKPPIKPKEHRLKSSDEDPIKNFREYPTT